MEAWSNFFFLCGSSAASLTGLMFIAATFGAKLVTRESMNQVNLFLSSIALHFMQVFFLCCLAAVPGLSADILAAFMIAFALGRMSYFPHNYRIMHVTAKDKRDVELSDWILTLWLPGLIYLLQITAGIFFFLRRPEAIYLMSTSVIFLLMVGMKSAWDMVLWMALTLE